MAFIFLFAKIKKVGRPWTEDGKKGFIIPNFLSFLGIASPLGRFAMTLRV